MKQLFFILALFFYTGLFAQGSLDAKISDAKFGVIKRTVEFLSTDTATFKGSKNYHCEPCAGYDDLTEFSAKLTKVPELIKEWQKMKVGGNKKDLEEFIKNVQTKITTGAPNRERRKSTAGYKEYLKDIDKIVADFSGTGEKAAVTDPPVVAPEAPKQETDPVPVPTPEHNPVPAPIDIPSWPYLAGGGVLALLALYFFMESRKASGKKEQLKRDVKMQKDQVKSKEESIINLRTEIKSLQEQLMEKDEQLTALIEKHDTEKKKYQQRVKDAREERTIDVTKESIAEQQPRGFEPIVKYARYADTGDGFSSANLLDNNDSETIFEITITAPGAGAYRITSNQQAQKYALSNASYFLNNTCVYDSLPSADSNIITNHPGKLVLQDNKWVISNPARISFN